MKSASEEFKSASEEFIPTRASLLSRLKDWQDQDSWKEFFDTYWRLIYNAGVRAGLCDAEAQDAVQETVISVMKNMPKFEYNRSGSFKQWLLQMTKWRVADQFRRRQKDLYESDNERSGAAQLESIPDPSTQALDSMWEEEWENTLVEAAMRRVKRSVDGKQYQLYDLYVIKKWPVRRVASILKVSIGAVYLAKHRVGAELKKHLAQLQTKPI